MPACEACWRVYAREELTGSRRSYAEVVAEQERINGGPCSPEEQCGDVHLVLDFKDGSRRCRCGKVKEGTPDV